jgi:hypothetical protein
MIKVEDTIFAFKFLKKYDLSLLSIEVWVLDRCRRAFDRLASVDAHLWPYPLRNSPVSRLDRRHTERLTGEGGKGRSQIICQRESMVL